MPNLTKEQQEIIDISKKLKRNEILSIQACAGSGKTYTLKEIAEQNPSKKYLYIAFNKAVADEASTKFPDNVNVKTIHALAFAYAKNHLGDFSPVSKITIFDLMEVFTMEKKYLFGILNKFNTFLNSDDTFEILDKKTSSYLYKIWNAVLENRIPMTHGFYLKYYEMAKNKDLDSKYDCILLDEAQDTNHVMLSIFLNNNCEKILVGDTFQNIYGFNNSINAFEVVETNFKTELSTSFRCKQYILDYADFFLNYFGKKEHKKMVSGIGEQESFTPKHKAIISRTNISLIFHIDSIKEDEIKDYFLCKEPDKLFECVLNVKKFINNNLDDLTREYTYFKKFSTKTQLKEYAREADDKELLGAFNLLENPRYDLKELYKKACILHDNKKAHIFLTNAHTSKGLEWDSVVLLDDFASLKDLEEELAKLKDLEKDSEKLKIKEEILEKKLEQELNLFYVAITRAKYKLDDQTKNKCFFDEQNKSSNKQKKDKNKKNAKI